MASSTIDPTLRKIYFKRLKIYDIGMWVLVGLIAIQVYPLWQIANQLIEANEQAQSGDQEAKDKAAGLGIVGMTHIAFLLMTKGAYNVFMYFAPLSLRCKNCKCELRYHEKRDGTVPEGGCQNRKLFLRKCGCKEFVIKP